ncbi:MAG TPA: 1-(5-phosphoribosyl)-5-[(5-phosphoribosylamino)methylideneamino]imidazole-4-carboxamide isomerase [Rhodothermales bacterium]|nr:1-(5-phosphoribosyl)-5-[(5-phosphoribosylamino)methylideneamino]imidazole-4-carboxamide isomerase [Rhodothermales bacterium]
MEIIPAIDLIGGKCVRLTQGDFNRQKTYHEDPLEVAKMFEGAGITRLHLVDLDGAREKHVVNHKVLENIARKTRLIVDFGGGIQSDEDLKIAFSSGAAMITGGSIAIRNRALFLHWLAEYGPDKIILGADAKDGKVAVSGWQDLTEVALLPFIQSYLKEGVQYVICTDIAKDGAMSGPSFELYKHLIAECEGLKLIASGGITHIEDLEKLRENGLHGAIIGKAIYEGSINLPDLHRFSN